MAVANINLNADAWLYVYSYVLHREKLGSSYDS